MAVFIQQIGESWLACARL